MFVPGSVKYLDLDGLISLAAPVPLVISGEDYPVTRKVYAASESLKRLKVTESRLGSASLLAELSLDD